MSATVYPKEYFEVMVFWAQNIARIQGISLYDAMLEYTDLYKSLTQDDWENRHSSELWQSFTSSLNSSQNSSEIAEIYYILYLGQPHSRTAIKQKTSSKLTFEIDTVRCGPLMLDFTPYNRERECVRIHYPSAVTKKKWLATENFAELQLCFKRLLEYASVNFSEAKYFISSTWLNNIPNFVKLFPESFNSRYKDIGGSSYLGLWGQFLRSDLQPNHDRINQFFRNLEQAKTLEEAIHAIPLKVLEATGDIKEFYAKYGIDS